MEKDNARTAAARLLGRLSAKAASPEQRKARASKGGKAAQKKLTPEQRSEAGKRAARARWAKRGQELPKKGERP